MHCKLYILLPKDQASNSEQARIRVSDYLDENNFCIESGGRWGGGIGDWFVIGGRWSGDLTVIKLDHEKYKKFWDEVVAKNLHLTSKNTSKEKQDGDIQRIFKNYFPEFDHKTVSFPVCRNQYQDIGYEDDAQIVDEEIWNRALAPGLKNDLYHGGAVIHTEGIEELEAGLMKDEVVGKCWCVVVDFHY